MDTIAIKYYLISFLLYTNNKILPIYGQGDALVEPDEISSSGGVLDVTLSIEYGTYSQFNFQLTDTRLFDGTLPGTTYRISAGDTMNIMFENNLEFQSGSVQDGENTFMIPDTSNLHFHGAHVSGELPSDDVRFDVGPGDFYQYSTHFPSNHMGGTHWIHPHVHGSSTVQVGGGAAKALIVEDEDGFLPNEVADATEVLLMIQTMDPTTLGNAASRSGDTRMSISNFGGLPGTWRIVNGQYQPKYSMTPNTWYRFRIINGGYLRDPLGLEISSCEMVLLAKDGIYIQDFPRTITVAPIPAGGRADIMVRCTTAGSYTMTDFASQTVMTLDVSGSSGSANSFSSWTPDYPDYLTDLTSTDATTGCSCNTNIRGCPGQTPGFCINEERFDKEIYIHTVEFGSTVERELSGLARHPYHQHVYPFQIVDSPNGISGTDATYWAVGDWHDVIQIESAQRATTRYVADVHTGVIMLHCHILTHEDEGTMSQEYVGESSSTSCSCDAFTTKPVSPTDSPTPSPTPSPNSPVSPSSPTPSPTEVSNLLAANDGQDDECFSSVATAIVENKGKVLVKDIQVGDNVLTGSKQYRTVYTIDHKHPTKQTRFLQIYSTETTSPLEITGTHMVFVNNTKNAIPANQVKVGDKIQVLRGDSTVTKISYVDREGIWNPITADGTIVVDGVIASTYGLHFGSENNIHVLGFDLHMSHHDFMHLLMTPYRAVCLGLSLSLCESRNNEFNTYSWLGKILLKFGLQQTIFVQNMMTLGLIITFQLLSSAMNPLTICFVLGVLFYHHLTKKRSTTCQRE